MSDISKIVLPDGNIYNLKDTVSGYQEALVSGTNIKTINNESILGSGNITIQGGSTGVTSVTATGALSSTGGTTPEITHNAPATSPAKTTQALYPVKIDAYGHITAAGSAVSIPTAASSVEAVGTSASAGVSLLYAREDHVHNIISSTITSALGFTPTSNTGTVTSVRVQATSPVQSSTSTAQSTSLNTTISLADGYGDTKNPYGSKTAKYVLAAPNGSAGAPSFRALVASDIPSLSYLPSSGGNVSGDITRSSYGTYRPRAWCYGVSTRSTNDTVAAGSYFYVPMNTTTSENPYLNVPTNSGTKLFASASGGIKVNRAGKYKISGSIYLGTGSSNGRAGAYIFDSTTSFSTAGTGVSTPPSTSTEVIGNASYGAGTDVVVTIAPKIVSLESGHIVHLVGRCMNQAGKIYYTNKSTYLLVEWVSD